MNHEQVRTVSAFRREHGLTAAEFAYAYGLCNINATRAGTTRLLAPDEQRAILDTREQIAEKRDACRHREVTA